MFSLGYGVGEIYIYRGTDHVGSNMMETELHPSWKCWYWINQISDHFGSFGTYVTSLSGNTNGNHTIQLLVLDKPYPSGFLLHFPICFPSQPADLC